MNVSETAPWCDVTVLSQGVWTYLIAMSEAFVILEQDSRLRTVNLLQCRPRLWAVLATTDNNVKI